MSDVSTPDRDGIRYATRRFDGRIMRVQELPCTCPDCQTVFARPKKDGSYPAEVFHRHASRAGWTIDRNKRRFFCPSHNPRNRQ